MGAITTAVWVCRDRVTPLHIKGLTMLLEQQGALDYAEIHILPVSEERGVHLPAGRWTGPDGTSIHPRQPCSPGAASLQQ